MSTTARTTSTPRPASNRSSSVSAVRDRTATIRTTSNNNITQAKSDEKPEKKLPPIKAQVGQAKGPDLTGIKSKIGSLQNVNHKPAPGEKKILTQKLEWKAKPRIGSLENAKHKPGGGEIKVENKKLEWKVQSKIGSLENMKHKPGGGCVKIFDEKYARSASESRHSGERRSVSPSSSITSSQTPNEQAKDCPSTKENSVKKRNGTNGSPRSPTKKEAT